jgi:ribosome-interacting GTPase 1
MSSGVQQRIADIEYEIKKTQKNKATNAHLCLLRGSLAKLRTQVMEAAKKQGGGGEGFDVKKNGDATVAMIGFPSVGKSSFLSKVTKTESEVAAWTFTTLTCIPGVIHYKVPTSDAYRTPLFFLLILNNV